MFTLLVLRILHSLLWKQTMQTADSGPSRTTKHCCCSAGKRRWHLFLYDFGCGCRARNMKEVGENVKVLFVILKNQYDIALNAWLKRYILRLYVEIKSIFMTIHDLFQESSLVSNAANTIKTVVSIFTILFLYTDRKTQGQLRLPAHSCHTKVKTRPVEN